MPGTPIAEPKGTPWAPSQHAGMACACVHWDAAKCLRGRNPDRLFDPDGEAGYGDDERCECGCHDRDRDDREDFRP